MQIQKQTDGKTSKFQTYCPRCGLYANVTKIETETEFHFRTQCSHCGFDMGNVSKKEVK